MSKVRALELENERLKIESIKLRARCELAEKAWVDYEEKEGSVCPEDMGFVEYIRILTKRCEESNAARMIAEQECKLAEKALELASALHAESGGCCEFDERYCINNDCDICWKNFFLSKAKEAAQNG